MQYFHIPESKIEVVYQGCDSAFEQTVSNEKREEIKLKYQLPEQYILNVGSIEERKNVLLAVKALPHLPQHIHLVIIGRRTPYTEQIECFALENQLISRIHIISNVPFEDLPAIYQSAEIFVYPSKFEGFGIPIIEALHSGIPVVAAKGSCLEEAGGKDSIYINPDDVTSIAQAFQKLLTDPIRKELMIAKGKEFVKRFSEQEQAMRIMNIYNEIKAGN